MPLICVYLHTGQTTALEDIWADLGALNAYLDVRGVTSCGVKKEGGCGIVLAVTSCNDLQNDQQYDMQTATAPPSPALLFASR